MWYDTGLRRSRLIMFETAPAATKYSGLQEEDEELNAYPRPDAGYLTQAPLIKDVLGWPFKGFLYGRGWYLCNSFCPLCKGPGRAFELEARSRSLHSSM